MPINLQLQVVVPPSRVITNYNISKLVRYRGRTRDSVTGTLGTPALSYINHKTRGGRGHRIREHPTENVRVFDAIPEYLRQQLSFVTLACACCNDGHVEY